MTMTRLRKYQHMVANEHSNLDYMTQIPMNEFAVELGRRMESQNVTRAELARRLGTSQAYITKVLGGATNFTIETMTKLAMALEGTLHLHIADHVATTQWIDRAPPGSVTVYTPRRSTTEIDSRLRDDRPSAAAFDTFAWS